MPTESAPAVTTANRAKEPDRQAISTPAYLRRNLFVPWQASQFRSEHWRSLIARAPIVRSCIQTLIMSFGGLPWKIVSEDAAKVDYYTRLLETADKGEGFDVHLSRIATDALTVPFGGAVEIGAYSDETVAWCDHIDGATMVPTYDEKYPYVQVNPWGDYDKPMVSFRDEQIGRMRWQAEPNLKAYGWTKTPCMDALPAIQALVRADRFWQQFLEDTPPAGILDVLGMTEDEAKEWLASFTEMLAGIDPTKIAILYRNPGEGGEVRPAQWIGFTKNPAELSMMEVLKLYAEEVTACFGMTIADLGIFGQEMRLAGAAKIMENSAKQGIAKLMRAFKTHVDMNILPDDAEFVWDVADDATALQKATAANMRATSIATLTRPDVGILTPDQGRLAAVHFNIIPQEVIDQSPTPADAGSGTSEAAASLGTGLEDTGNNPSGAVDQARARPQSFPASSKAAKRMEALTEDRLLKPALAGATQARIEKLIKIGLDAWTNDEGERSFTRIMRSRDTAKAALQRALQDANWWKSPDLVDEVAAILREAFDEGAVGTIQDIEIARAALDLPGVDVATTSFNVTNKAVLEALETRGGAFITNINEGTRRYITDAILRGVQAGISSPEIAKNILADRVQADLVEQWKNRTKSIVNTEINWAESYASMEQQARVGLKLKRWVAIPGLACAICLTNDGLGSVANDYQYTTATGSSEHTPGHPGICHCYMSFDEKELKKLGTDIDYWMGK